MLILGNPVFFNTELKVPYWQLLKLVKNIYVTTIMKI